MWFYRSILSKALTGGAIAGLAICGALAASLLLEHTAQVERLEDVLETSTHRFMLGQTSGKGMAAQRCQKEGGNTRNESRHLYTSIIADK